MFGDRTIIKTNMTARVWVVRSVEVTLTMTMLNMRLARNILLLYRYSTSVSPHFFNKIAKHYAIKFTFNVKVL